MASLYASRKTRGSVARRLRLEFVRPLHLSQGGGQGSEPLGPSAGIGCQSGWRVVGHGGETRCWWRAGRQEGELRRTPTWRAKCRISGSGRPLRFELWGAHGDLSTTDSRFYGSQEILARKKNTQRTRGLYWFGPPMWCNTLLQCVVWWIASGADDEQYRGKNGLARV